MRIILTDVDYHCLSEDYDLSLLCCLCAVTGIPGRDSPPDVINIVSGISCYCIRDSVIE